MKVAYSAITEVKQVAPKKRVPMYKDPVLIAEMTNWLIDTNNRKLKAKQA